MKRPSNFRDLGGIRAVDGREIKPKRLLRSGEPVGLAQQEKDELVSEYGLKTIVDFRTSQEALRNPDDPMPGVEVINVDLMEAMSEYAPGTDTEQNIKDVEGVHQFMMVVYGDTLNDKTAQQKMAQFFHIAQGQKEGALLFHCFAGKDRTGMAAAMLLTLLGVDKGAIYTDYLLTNELRKESNREIWEEGEAKGLPQKDLMIMNEFMLVHKSYLDHMYEVAEKQNGSLLEFVKANMGVTGKDIEELKDNYLL